MQISTINNFIKKNLVKKIRSDARASKRITPKITNERDLESAIYYHLREKLKTELDLKISTNYTFSGVKKRHETTFVQPDIVISQWIDDFHPKFIENSELASVCKPLAIPPMPNALYCLATIHGSIPGHPYITPSDNVINAATTAVGVTANKR